MADRRCSLGLVGTVSSEFEPLPCWLQVLADRMRFVGEPLFDVVGSGAEQDGT